MHILILPSEEFVPAECPVAGIFQYHQAAILKEAGYQVGALSVSLSFSIPMLLKAMVFKIIGKKVNNNADKFSFLELGILAYHKIFKAEKFIKAEVIEGIPVVRIDGFFYGGPKEQKNHFGWTKAGETAYDYYIKKYGTPQLIHAHNAVYAGMLAHKLYVKYKIPFILTEHSTAFARQLIKDKKVLSRIKEVYTESRMLFAVSEPFCNLLNKRFGINRFRCLPNVLDSYLENKDYQPHQNGKKEFIFLNIAELHPKKDHITLLKAFKKVNESFPHSKLWIGGNGELLPELTSFVKNENLTSSVTFLGSLNREEVHKAIVQSDCFVLSSRFETFGVVVIEAMLFGKPVIVTRCGGPEGFVTDEVGQVVNKENENELGKAMLEMISHHKKFKASAIREYTIANFGKKQFLQKVDAAYKMAI